MKLRSAAALLAVATAAAEAAPLQKEGVSVELVCAAETLQPGTRTHVGLLFTPEEDFHIYWRQPGLVGMAPVIRWELPEGYEVGPLLWPQPEEVEMGVWRAWGHRRPVVIGAELRVPEGAAHGEVTLRASAHWMACSTTCHPGSADLALTLPVRAAEAEESAAATIIRQTLAEQPHPAAGWKFQARRASDHVLLRVTPPEGATLPQDAVFFGYDRLVDSHQPVSRSRCGRTTELRLPITELPEESLEQLRGILVSGEGFATPEAHSLEFSVPLDQGASP